MKGELPPSESLMNFVIKMKTPHSSSTKYQQVL